MQMCVFVTWESFFFFQVLGLQQNVADAFLGTSGLGSQAWERRRAESAGGWPKNRRASTVPVASVEAGGTNFSSLG